MICVYYCRNIKWKFMCIHYLNWFFFTAERSNRQIVVLCFSAAQDETGVYKNLLQETAHRAGLNLPVYTTIRSGPGHVPVFSCTVEIAGMSFTGEAAKTKKQAQKNAAMTAWSALRKCMHHHFSIIFLQRSDFYVLK